MTVERRIITRGTAVRALGSGDSLAIGGIAAPFNTYANLKGFRERILPGAFKKVLRAANKGAGDLDVACLFNHDPSLVLGRMSNRMLTAEEVSSGLQFRCQLDPSVSYHRDLHALIQNRSITGCSFGFGCAPDGSDEQWDEAYEEGLDDGEDDNERSKRSAKFIRRTIHNFSMLSDVGPVTYPAYSQGTSVDARSLVAIPDACPREFRSLICEAREFALKHNDVVARRQTLLNSIL